MGGIKAGTERCSVPKERTIEGEMSARCQRVPTIERSTIGDLDFSDGVIDIDEHPSVTDALFRYQVALFAAEQGERGGVRRNKIAENHNQSETNPSVCEIV